MKKAYLLGLLAFGAMGFTACDNYEEPNPQPQTNEQCPVLAADDVTVASSVTEGTTVSLIELNDAGESLTLGRIALPAMPEGYAFAPVVEISGNGFSTSGTVPCSVVAAEVEEGQAFDIVVNPDAFNAAYVGAVSKSPKAKTCEWRVKLPVNYGANSAGIVGGPDKYYGPYQLTVLPLPSDFVIEENYYLLGTANDWSVATAIKLDHTGDPYDNPVWTGVFELNGDWWWKIIPESTFVTGNWVDAKDGAFGVTENGDTALKGMLVGRTDTEDCGAGNLKETGTYLLTINMEEGTYEFTLALPNLWVVGNHQGWSPATAPIIGTNNYQLYGGFMHLDGEFKFTAQPDWDPLNWGGADGKLEEHNSVNCGPIAAGFYCVRANIVDLTWKTVEVTSLGLIGSATAAGWDGQVNLTPSDDMLVWEGDVDLTEGEYKFRASDDWDANLGGDLSNLTVDGANIVVKAKDAGHYHVRLDLTQWPYQATLTK